ncbi:Histidine kinase-like ATPase domain-containing protein [Actinacidiphila alni]|uniref:Histidine kinase-like ATPase domain-containing protein n=1 Tax=Actinacidiphila alni TaxID=380248 RepID=A0A1I2G512_9ACTN|nr:ATP-binding protein [Actinacidiphila alni]SFF12814.1 Histidine kinase-like ATPase domain-containing protein [Actinacidiphila alni]
MSGRTHIETFRIRRSSVPAARRHVETTLTTWKLGPLIEPATLITSELATNVVAHATGIGEYFELGLRRRDGVLVIEVGDSYQWAMPEKPAALDPEALGGRGLVIVEALSAKWGVRPRSPGKTVWAHLPLGDR